MYKFQQSLNQSIHHLQIADHMTYVTYPLINEKRLLLRIIEEISASITYCINAILEFEEKSKSKKLDKNFILKKYSKNYNLNENQIQQIKEILEINNKHKESAMEFVKNEKLVILSNNLGTKIIDIQLIKSYLLTAKELLLKVNQRIERKIP